MFKDISFNLDTDNEGYLVASTFNTSGEKLYKNSSLERTEVSPRFKRFDVITEEADERSAAKTPMLFETDAFCEND